MTSDSENELEKQRWKICHFCSFNSMYFVDFVFALEHGMGWDFHKAVFIPENWKIFGAYLHTHSFMPIGNT
jgi:hypothetical protein